MPDSSHPFPAPWVRRLAPLLALGALALAPAPAWADVLSDLDAEGRPDSTIESVTPSQGRGGYIAKVVAPVRALDEPDGRRLVWRIGTQSIYTRNATQLMVLAARYDATGRPWIKVQLPIRPNGADGWIPADAALVRRTRWFVRVRLRSRLVTVYHRGGAKRRARAVVGAPGTPTPTGQFALYEFARQRSPRDFLGSWALHLTSFSDVLDNYGGGPGRVAIHGRGPASKRDAPLGSAGSHGCIRIDNEDIDWMRARLSPGTPFRVTSR